ncbi:G-protein coupled receptor Mth2 [Anabrus simplex]|uniref:G-protein coupled receptor Mth2 n=1 Tax=Anabrus simplex TaxID=316456 RepID=UPI0035A27F3C
MASKAMVSAVKIFSAILSMAVTVGAHRCCPDDLPVLLEKNYCYGLQEGYLQLNCSEEGMYHLNPHLLPDDHFELVGTELQVGPPDGRKYNISNGSFCITRLANSSGHQVVPTDVAVVCFEMDDEEYEYLDESIGLRNLLNGICLCISATFLLATLLVYCILPDLRDLDGKCLMGYMLSLAIAYISLALLQFHGHRLDDLMCVTQAFFLYYWMLSAFFWLNLVSFNVWRRTMWWRMSMAAHNKLFPAYACYGYGLPLIFLFVALVSEHSDGDHIKPKFGVTKCWFDGPQESWAYFYGPVAVLLTCNIMFFVWTGWCLWKTDNQIKVMGKLRSMRYKCMLYVKLSLLMGLTWIFEVISFIQGDSVPFFWYCTDLLNCLQGVIIFLLMVAFRKRVLRGMVKNKPLGIKVPHQWAQGVDEESEAILADEELCHTQVPN